jgi:hypothetical protein
MQLNGGNGMKQLRKRNVLILGVLVTMLAVMSCGKVSSGNRGNSGAAGSSKSKESSSAQEVTPSSDTSDQGDTASTGETDTTQADGSDANAPKWSPEMEKIRTAVVTALGDMYWPNAAISPEVLKEGFGVAPDLYDDYMAESPMVSVNIDTLVIIKPKEGKAQEVFEILEGYRKDQQESAAQYPRNIAKVQASSVVTVGDYVCFVMLGADSASGLDASSEEAINKNVEQNNIAILAIDQEVLH